MRSLRGKYLFNFLCSSLSSAFVEKQLVVFSLNSEGFWIAGAIMNLALKIWYGDFVFDAFIAY